jgi:hypothetical protein
VPDLVFSEMRFLQKENEQPEPAPQQGTVKKKSKRDHAHTKEAEISAFFTAARPVLAEEDNNNVRTNEVRANNDKTNMIGHRGPRKYSAVLPTIEIPDKGPCLGIEGRGPRHGSASYVSWSDSVPGPDLTIQRQKYPLVVEENQHQSSKDRTGHIATVEESSSFKHPASPSVTSQRRDVSAERFKVSSVVVSQHKIDRSHSYPLRNSSPRKVVLVGGAVNIRSTVSADSPSSMLLFVPTHTRTKNQSSEPSVSSRLTKHQETSLSTSKHVSKSQHVRVTSECDRDVRRRTSSDLGKVIRQCNSMFQEHRRVAEPRVNYILTTSHGMNDMERCAHPLDPRKAHKRPAVHLSEVELPPPRLPNFSGPSIYEQQAHRRQALSQTEHHEDLVLEDSYLTDQEFVEEQDDMLYNDETGEGQFEELVSYSSGRIGSGYSMEDSRATNCIVQRLASDHGIVASGFWRPNKLY